MDYQDVENYEYLEMMKYDYFFDRYANPYDGTTNWYEFVLNAEDDYPGLMKMLNTLERFGSLFKVVHKRPPKISKSIVNYDSDSDSD